MCTAPQSTKRTTNTHIALHEKQTVSLSASHAEARNGTDRGPQQTLGLFREDNPSNS